MEMAQWLPGVHYQTLVSFTLKKSTPENNLSQSAAAENLKLGFQSRAVVFFWKNS